jgi:hypothetical protein
MIALHFLAKANWSDEPGANLVQMMTWLVLIAAVAIAAFLPFRLAIAGGRRRGEGLTALIVLWALIAAFSGIQTSMARSRWSQDYQIRLQSGYYDPADPHNVPPPRPWKTWAALAGGYAALIVLAARGTTGRAPGFDLKNN